MTHASGNGLNGPGRVKVKQACTVLFDNLPPLNPGPTRAMLAQLVGECTVEWAKGDAGAAPMTAGLAQFGHHKIAMVAINATVKSEVLARTVGVSPMPEDLRQALMDHRATVRLLYTGEADDPVTQLTALYAVAEVMLLQGGLGILNERAALAQPTELAVEYLAELGQDPPPIQLWVGVVTFAEGVVDPAERFLMRTYGMEQFGLPDVAMTILDRSAADSVYHGLLNVCLYLVENGPALQVSAGHRAEFQGHAYLFTEPGSHEPQYRSPHGLLLLVEV